jgi:hypothetical protein
MPVRVIMITAVAALCCRALDVHAQAAPPAAPADTVEGTPAERTPRRDARAAPRGRKSPVGAGLLGLVVPGAGHVYAGEPIRGGVTLATYVGAAAVISDGPDALWRAGGVVLLGAWVFGVVDGAQAARRHNAGRPGAGGRGAPLRLIVAPASRGLRIGVHLRSRGAAGR